MNFMNFIYLKLLFICYESNSFDLSRNNMIKNNIGLVHYFAYKLYPGQVNDDLLQEGKYGLIKAVDKFDPNMGTQFSTYASYWIRATMRLYMSEKHHIHIPQKKRKNINQSSVILQDDMSKMIPSFSTQNIQLFTELYDIINHVNLTKEEINMLEQRFLYDVSYTKYGTQKGISKTTARNQYLKLYKKIRHEYKIR